MGGLAESEVSADINERVCRLLTVSNTAKIWNASTGKCMWTLGETSNVAYATMSPNGSFVVTALRNGTTIIWSAISGERLYDLTLCRRDTYQVPPAFSVNEAFVLTASDQKTVKMWSTLSGECIWEFVAHTDPVYTAEFSNDMLSVATCSDDKTAMIWSTTTGDCRLVMTGHEDSVIAATFSVESDWVLTASLDNSAKIWDSRSGVCIHTLGEPRLNSRYCITDAHFSVNGRVLTVSEQGQVKIWNAIRGTCILTLERPTGLNDYITRATFSADGLSFLTVARKHVKIWCATTGHCRHTLERTDSSFYDAVFSTDGRLALTGGTEVNIWNARTGLLVFSFKAHESEVCSVQCSQ